ncbi:hypothetical protein ENKNEFLB_00137 [Nocardioides aquaticus]|uniref:Uncharacterized protein n=1 Tax=Nocardioides aquaticus TaxID=160826 RepID=A0ABX8EC53_9ACTN|nr:hypothetical protein [Nocardioides aquaticus]QVT77771.1 hypothetical protein ENKNEFLB_00137 [Nocardioides aquaticus]
MRPPAAAARLTSPRLLAPLWLVLVAAGAALLVLGLVPVGPDELSRVGAVVVSTAYAWALAARVGGRPVLFGSLALVAGVLAVVLDLTWLRTGASVATCVVAAVLGVVATVPAVRFRLAARECLVAVVVAGVGALAALGYAPTLTLTRFEYLTLALAMVATVAVVQRLGAGLHGLGRRGLLAVVAGTLLLAVTLLYAELLRRYGTPTVVDNLLDGVVWVRDTLGAFPRPIATVVGVPALAWGCHMRARRRQGWWVCAFGAAATASTATALVNPGVTLLESGLSVLYGLVVGLVLGYLLIRVDLAVTGTRGRRSRAAEQGLAVRPEPRRTEPLL